MNMKIYNKRLMTKGVKCLSCLIYVSKEFLRREGWRELLNVIRKISLCSAIDDQYLMAISNVGIICKYILCVLIIIYK